MSNNNSKHCNNCSNCDNCYCCDNCNNCYKCSSCDYCDNCYKCSYCFSCNNSSYCGSSEFLNNCYNCSNCKNVDYCNYSKNCSYSYYCKGINSVHHNLFCWSNDFKSRIFIDDTYRIFNVEVTKELFWECVNYLPNYKLDFDSNEDLNTGFQTAFKKLWVTLSKDEKQLFFDIPHFNMEGFTFITGIDIL